MGSPVPKNSEDLELDNLNKEERTSNESPTSTTPDPGRGSGRSRGRSRGRGQRRRGRGRTQALSNDPVYFPVVDPEQWLGQNSEPGPIQGRGRGRGGRGRGRGSTSRGQHTGSIEFPLPVETGPGTSAQSGNASFMDRPPTFRYFPSTSQSTIASRNSVLTTNSSSTFALQTSNDLEEGSNSPKLYIHEPITPSTEEIMGVIDTMNAATIFDIPADPSAQSLLSTGVDNLNMNSEASRHPNLAQMLEASNQIPSTSSQLGNLNYLAGRPDQANTEESRFMDNIPSTSHSVATVNQVIHELEETETSGRTSEPQTQVQLRLRLRGNEYQSIPIVSTSEPQTQEQHWQGNEGEETTNGRNAEFQSQAQQLENGQSEDGTDDVQFKTESKVKAKRVRSVQKRRAAEADDQMELQSDAVGQEAPKKRVKKEPAHSVKMEGEEPENHAGTSADHRTTANPPQFHQQNVANGLTPHISNSAEAVSSCPKYTQPKSQLCASNYKDSNGFIYVICPCCCWSSEKSCNDTIARQQLEHQNANTESNNANQNQVTSTSSFNQAPQQHSAPNPNTHQTEPNGPCANGAQSLAQASQGNGNSGRNRELQAQIDNMQNGNHPRQSTSPEPYGLPRYENVSPAFDNEADTDVKDIPGLDLEKECIPYRFPNPTATRNQYQVVPNRSQQRYISEPYTLPPSVNARPGQGNRGQSLGHPDFGTRLGNAPPAQGLQSARGQIILRNPNIIIRDRYGNVVPGSSNQSLGNGGQITENPSALRSGSMNPVTAGPPRYEYDPASDRPSYPYVPSYSASARPNYPYVPPCYTQPTYPYAPSYSASDRPNYPYVPSYSAAARPRYPYVPAPAAARPRYPYVPAQASSRPRYPYVPPALANPHYEYSTPAAAGAYQYQAVDHGGQSMGNSDVGPPPTIISTPAAAGAYQYQAVGHGGQSIGNSDVGSRLTIISTPAAAGPYQYQAVGHGGQQNVGNPNVESRPGSVYPATGLGHGGQILRNPSTSYSSGNIPQPPPPGYYQGLRQGGHSSGDGNFEHHEAQQRPLSHSQIRHVHGPNVGPSSGNAVPPTGFNQKQGQGSQSLGIDKFSNQNPTVPGPSRSSTPGPLTRLWTVGFPLPVLVDPTTCQPMVRERLMSVAEIFPPSSLMQSANSGNRMAPPLPPPTPLLVRVKLEKAESRAVGSRTDYRAYHQRREAARGGAPSTVETITLYSSSEDEGEQQDPRVVQASSSMVNVITTPIPIPNQTTLPYMPPPPPPQGRPQESSYSNTGRAPEVQYGELVHTTDSQMEGNSSTMPCRNAAGGISHYTSAAQQGSNSYGSFPPGIRPPPAWSGNHVGPAPLTSTISGNTLRPRRSRPATSACNGRPPSAFVRFNSLPIPSAASRKKLAEFHASSRIARAVTPPPPSHTRPTVLRRPAPPASAQPGSALPRRHSDRPPPSASVGIAPTASASNVPMSVNSSRLQTLAAVAAAAGSQNPEPNPTRQNVRQFERHTNSASVSTIRLHYTTPIEADPSVQNQRSTMSNALVKPEETENPAGSGALDLRKLDNVPKRDGDGNGSGGGAKGVKLCTWCSKRNICTPNNGLMGSSGSWTYCSERCYEQFRRDVFKRRAACLWCSNLNTQGQYLNSVSMHSNVDESKFCSEYCLNQFKLKLFFETVESETTNLQLKESHGALALSAIPGSSLGFSSSKDLITPASWLSAVTPSNPPLKTPSLSGNTSPAPLSIISAPHVSPELTLNPFVHNGSMKNYVPSKPGSILAPRLSITSQRPNNSTQKHSHPPHPLNNSSPPKRLRHSSSYHGAFRTGLVTPHLISKPRSQTQTHGTPSRTVNSARQEEQSLLFEHKSPGRRTLPIRPSVEADSGSGKPDSTFVSHLNSEKEPKSSARQEEISEAEKGKVIFVIPYPYPLVIPFPLPFSMYNSLMTTSQGMERNSQKTKGPLLLHDQLELD